MQITVDICREMCSHFATRDKLWSSCKDCVKSSKFTYRKGSSVILDIVYESGIDRGYRKGVEELAESAD